MESYIQSVGTLINACEQELIDLGYGELHSEKLKKHWKEFALWMDDKGYESLTPEIGRQYCFETAGSDVLSGIDKRDHLKLRSSRMLISFQEDGCFEFRTPTVAPLVFHGESGKLMEAYLDNARYVQQYSDSTISEKRLRLHELNTYLENQRISVGEINQQILTSFIVTLNYSVSKTRLFCATIKQLFRYAYEIGAVPSDLSFIVMPVSKPPEKLPVFANIG